MMFLELQFTAFLTSAGNGPVSSCNQTPPPLRTAGCCSHSSSHSALQRCQAPLAAMPCSSATGYRATRLLSSAEVGQFLSSQIMVQPEHQPEIPHKKLVGQYIPQLNFFSCRKFRGASLIFPLHLIYHQLSTMKSQYSSGAPANRHHSRALYGVNRLRGAKFTFHCAADIVNFLLQVVKTNFLIFWESLA